MHSWILPADWLLWIPESTSSFLSSWFPVLWGYSPSLFPVVFGMNTLQGACQLILVSAAPYNAWMKEKGTCARLGFVRVSSVFILISFSPPFCLPLSLSLSPLTHYLLACLPACLPACLLQFSDLAAAQVLKENIGGTQTFWCLEKSEGWVGRRRELISISQAWFIL